MKPHLLLLLFMLAAPLGFAAPAHSLTVGDGFVDPISFPDAQPVFSWKLPTGTSRQTAYRLEITAADRSWDSGWIESAQSVRVPGPPDPFAAGDRATWRVNVRDEQGDELGWSDPARFELGLLTTADWSAAWIRPSQAHDPDAEPVGELRRTFSLDQSVTRARLHVTARGAFALQLNGTRVGDDHFVPGLTPYENRIDTLTYDVTDQLRPGDNTLHAALGTGWFAGRYPFEAEKPGPYGRHPQLLLQLELTLAGGSTRTIVSDKNWEGSFNGPIRSSSIYDGEHFDARQHVSDWAPVDVDPDLSYAVLQPKPFAPVRATETLATQAISEPVPGRFIFDLGQNMVGWARLQMPVQRDQTITVKFGEMLQADGTLYNANYRAAKSTDTYTAATDGTITWEPHFTFHGFRYVELSGLAPDAAPQPDWVTGVVLHSDLTPTGTFTSSHAKLNQLQSNIVWGWRGNSLDIPTDCPQRDERAGWTGDAQVFCPTAMFLTDGHAFWRSWLASMRLEQDADGVIPSIIPSANIKWRARSPGWMDAAAVIPWEVYVRTGDATILAENFAMMEKLVGWYRSQSVDGLLPTIEGFGDWLQPHAAAQITPEDGMGDRRGDTPRPLLGVAYYARSTQLLAQAARVLGRDELAATYAAEAAAIRAAFTRAYFDAEGRLQNVPESQTAYALAIAFDLLPAKLIPAAGEHLARLVRDVADTHLRTGFLGTPVLTFALDRTGHADLAAALLFQESYPSWFYPINQGATTMWERWNSYTHADGFGDVSMNSFNHYAYGAVGQWMYERIAGLAPDPAYPGYKHILVRPLVVPQLDHAEATLETPYGLAASGWRRVGDTVTLTVTVPPNSTATVTLPDGATHVCEPGTRTFTFPAPATP
ncbi:family 78 glycoside hydrolase catalytic domain [Actomonas aquatica]|uniref:alpha-L-rhamnosidase n=1 Tax=Actomonas aquatica TaxID=2866162 RepID=A0ABZ1C4S0_9BACT|nr:family 78 glycoside hydrolase catalytic domain [Opitutus sp. WL0086]WRQ86728.1 family 78 glycoside hydrolase catalytic domain [Opitutus sp. WL0086]